MACLEPLASAAVLLSRDASGSICRFKRCRRCGLLSQMGDTAQPNLPLYYPAESYGLGEAKFPGLLALLQRRTMERRARMVRRLTGSTAGSILDVGCGDGSFLGLMARCGWRVSGTEIPGPAWNRARNLAGLALLEGDLRDGAFAGQRFDVVTFWHSLEHLPDPFTSLTQARGLLANGGVLLIEVPNAASIQARVFAGRWLHLDPPRHLQMFTPRSLEILLGRCGFAVGRRETLAWGMGVFGVVQSLLNLIQPRDLLYRLLLTRFLAPSSTTHRLLACAGGLALLPVGALWTAVETGWGRGPVLRFVCRPTAV